MTSKEICKDIIEGIISGEMPECSKLPSESSLSLKYNCNRHTIRSALQYLIERGYLLKIHGGSTYVNKIPTEHILSLSSMFDLHGAKALKSKVFYFSKIKPSQFILDKLALKEGQEVFKIVRGRYIDDTIHHLEEIYMPYSLFPKLKESNCYASLLSYIEDQCGYEITHSIKTIESTLLNEDEATLLNLEQNKPILQISNIGYLTTGRIYEYSINKHINKKIEFFAKR